MDGFWLGVTAAATLALALFGFFAWYSSRIKVKAKVERHPVNIPESLLSSIEQIAKRFDREDIIKIFESSELKERSEYLLCFLTEAKKIYEDPFCRSGTCSHLEISNVGNEVASGLEIKANGVYLIETLDENDWVEIKLNTFSLKPGDTKKLRIWQHVSLDMDIKVYQDKGKVSLVEYQLSHPFFEAISYLWDKGNRIIVLLVIVFCLQFSYSLYQALQEKQLTESVIESE
ncbi:hypothetical protein [Alkalimonas mucilaginosa]|uniref:Uncharacterized protein n=1 Tax=Alkalimonas mucilaginosa TaxID=3057676 RepID=A0ABU7JJ55_9GAMM|nr:hypothetical protein [Alkalimonas sp. MEB004]MEE2025711.1 hypothetical protein [Alkalimonas sp. MEB004]